MRAAAADAEYRVGHRLLLFDRHRTALPRRPRRAPPPAPAGSSGRLPLVRGQTPGLPPRGARPRLAASANAAPFARPVALHCGKPVWSWRRGTRGGGRRVRHGVRTSLDVLGMTENQALRIENGYHLVPVSPCDHEAGGPWTNPELQRPPRRRRMASTRPPGTYSPSARTGRRGGGSGSVDGMVRRAGSDALSMSLRSTAPVGSSAGQHPPPEPAEHSVQVSGLL